MNSDDLGHEVQGSGSTICKPLATLKRLPGSIRPITLPCAVPTRLATGLPLLAVAVLGLRLVSHNVSGDRGRAGGAVPRLRTSTVMLLAGAAWLGSNAVPIVGQWLPVGGAAVPADNAWARLGVVLDRTTSADASLAVVAAGNVSYFSHRPTEDVLGKKLVMLWSPTRSDYEYLCGFGYVEIGTMLDDNRRNYCFETLAKPNYLVTPGRFVSPWGDVYPNGRRGNEWRGQTGDYQRMDRIFA